MRHPAGSTTIRGLDALVLGVLLALAVSTVPSTVWASDEDRSVDVYLSAGGEAWPTPDAGGHGWLLAAISLDKMPADGRLTATFNTETLSLDYTDLRVSESVRLGFRLKGELGFARLMPDYYRRGKLLAERGFSASYVEAHAHGKWFFAPYQSLEFHLDGRRWIFGETEQTSPDLVLPPERYEATSTLRYVYWSLDDDPSISAPHRPFWRVRGAAFGLDVGGTYRSDASAWGARSRSFSPRDPRNDPDPFSLQLDQWFKAGHQFMPSARIQFSEWAGWSEGVDDLGRDAIGGMNPFVIPVAGLPWASLLSERYLVAQTSFHFRIWRQIEAGVLADVGTVADIRRDGDLNDFGAAAGFGAFLDARLGSWQADLRLGWSPDFNWQAAAPHLSVLVSAGKRF